MRKIKASEIENWSFKGLPGTEYWAVDEPDDSTKLLLSVVKVEQDGKLLEVKPSYVFVLKVADLWHISPWLNDKMVDTLLRVAPPSVALKRVMPQEEPQG